MVATFHRAQKSAAFLRMALAGPSGSGKTYTALLIAAELAGDKGVAVIDTERGSASKYSDIFTFDVLELDNFHPNHYIEAIQAAAESGYGALVIDSLSHAWNGSGGLLELHENAVKRQQTKNSYTAWAEITPIQNKLINAITGTQIHIIATMRSKTEYTIVDKKVEKLGMAPIQRDGMEYEFDVFAEMTTGNMMLVQKSRCPELSDATIGKPGKGVADTLRMWLRGTDGGSTPAPRGTAPEPTAPVETNEKPAAPTAKARVAPAAKTTEQLAEEAEKELKQRALDLGFTAEQYEASRKFHKTYARTADALNRYEQEQKQLAEAAQAMRDKQDLEDVAEMEAGWLPEDGSMPSNDADQELEQPTNAVSQMEMHAWELLFDRHSKAGGDTESWDGILRTAKGDLQLATQMVANKEEFNLHNAPQFAGSKGRS